LRHIPRNPKENWKAAQPSAEALRSAFAFVESIDQRDIPLPFIAPGSRGSVQFEWRVGNRELDVRFAKDGSAIFCRMIDEAPMEDERPLGTFTSDLFPWLLQK
jgi:hypothetical protein